MNEESLTFQIGGIWFDGTVCLMTLLVCIIVFIFTFVCSRNLKMRPKGKQNFIETIIDFCRNVMSDSIPKNEIGTYLPTIFTLFLFIFVSNVIGLTMKIVTKPDEITLWKSPTADVTLTLTAAVIITIACNIMGIRKFGFKGYFVNSFMSPTPIILPIKIMEEFTNTMTLALRLFGNIFAGEILLTLIAQLSSSFGIISFVGALPLEVIWQGFSVFIGFIQAYIFITLTSVYLSHKIEKED